MGGERRFNKASGELEYPVGDAEIQEQRLPSTQSGCGLITSENRKWKVRGAAL